MQQMQQMQHLSQPQQQQMQQQQKQKQKQQKQQCRGFFGARGNWLELDEGAAAIWWAEEPPHDVHGPG